jgi:hypothetical protein
MEITIATLRAAGLSEAQVLRVIEISEKERLLHRREQNRKAQQNHRSRQHFSTYAADAADAYILKKEVSKKERKKTICTVPAEWVLTDKRAAYAADKGWTPERSKTEFQRFKDRAASKGITYRDVDAAWRNWVTSPYQNGAANGHTHAPRPGSRQDREERTHAAMRQLDEFANGKAANDGGEGREVGPPDVSLLPLFRPA